MLKDIGKLIKKWKEILSVDNSAADDSGLNQKQSIKRRLERDLRSYRQDLDRMKAEFVVEGKAASERKDRALYDHYIALVQKCNKEINASYRQEADMKKKFLDERIQQYSKRIEHQAGFVRSNEKMD